MNQTVLITGGSGLIGSKLSELLLTKGYKIIHLSRSKSGKEEFKTYSWDIDKKILENDAIESADYIVHLAGAKVSERWTKKRKKEILESRTKSSGLLYEKLSTLKHNVKAIVSASGVGIYGTNTGDQVVTENSGHGDDFLAVVTRKWEEGVERMEHLNIRAVRLRIGIVLSKDGGALPKLMMPIKYGSGAPLGSGKQFYSWIHIKDLCKVFLEAIENDKMSGAYNAVASNPLTNKEFTKILALKLNRPLILPNVPAFVLQLILGEMSNIVTGGNKVSNEKLKREGFEFMFNDFGVAIDDILND